MYAVCIYWHYGCLTFTAVQLRLRNSPSRSYPRDRVVVTSPACTHPCHLTCCGCCCPARNEGYEFGLPNNVIVYQLFYFLCIFNTRLLTTFLAPPWSRLYPGLLRHWSRTGHCHVDNHQCGGQLHFLINYHTLFRYPYATPIRYFLFPWRRSESLIWGHFLSPLFCVDGLPLRDSSGAGTLLYTYLTLFQ